MPRVTINLKSFTCYRDTSEWDSDEPYVLVFAARPAFPPSARTVLYGPWSDVDSGERGKTGQLFFGPGGAPLVPPENFWGLNGQAADLEKDDDAIFLVALMEKDNGRPPGVRTGLHSVLVASLSSYLSSGMSRAEMVRQLLVDMRDTLRGILAIGVPNIDDLINVGELRVNISAQRSASSIDSLHLNGDGGRYELFFETRIA